MQECERQLLDAIEKNIAKCKDTKEKRQLKILKKLKKEIMKKWLTKKERN
mgnify:CR=1 FL=1